MSDLFRLTEPVAAVHDGKLRILPEGTVGVKADPWPGENPDTFAFIVDAQGGSYDGARAPEVVRKQVALVAITCHYCNQTLDRRRMCPNRDGRCRSTQEPD